MPKKTIRPLKSEIEEAHELRFLEEVATLVLQMKTNVQIIEEINERYDDPKKLTEKKLRMLLASPEYRATQEGAMDELRRDPRRSAVLGHVQDLLPRAAKRLEEALDGEEVPWSVRRWAVETIFGLSGITKEVADDDAGELREFLGKLGVENVNINVIQIAQQILPQEYVRQMQTHLGEVIEGEIVSGEESLLLSSGESPEGTPP